MDSILLTSGVLVLLFGTLLMVHVMEWRLYVAARKECDVLRQNLVAMTADRDAVIAECAVWRSVGERALLVAHLATRVTNRATSAALAAQPAETP